jgi:UDP-N-acetylglucosamine acyltransferase
MAHVHPTAILDPRAELASDVTVGPYAVIGPGVQIDAGCRVGAHTVIEGPTRIGPHNDIRAHAVIGGPPQDKKYRGEPTRLDIGSGNTIHEFVTINRGTVQDEGLTRVGNDNWIMATVHIAHDCRVGDHVILANTTNLAGHVHVGDWVILGGYTGVHQFCKIGAHAMTGVGSVVLHDIPPFVMASGNTAQAHGLNTEGLRRRGFAGDTIAALRRAYKTLYRSGLTLAQAREALQQQLQESRAEALAAGSLSAPHSQAVSEAPAQEGRAWTTIESLQVLTDFLSRVERGIVR